jgi:uncharacterized protein YciI
MRNTLPLLALLFACAHEQAAAPQPNWLVVYRPGPAWLAGKPVGQQPLKEHGRFLIGLYKKGILRFAGPFTDDAGGAAALLVPSEEEAKALIASDPAVVAGVMIPTLHPWRLVDWAVYVKKSPNQ